MNLNSNKVSDALPKTELDTERGKGAITFWPLNFINLSNQLVLWATQSPHFTNLNTQANHKWQSKKMDLYQLPWITTFNLHRFILSQWGDLVNIHLAAMTNHYLSIMTKQEDGSLSTPLDRFIQSTQVYSITARGLGQDSSCCNDKSLSILNPFSPMNLSCILAIYLIFLHCFYIYNGKPLLYPFH